MIRIKLSEEEKAKLEKLRTGGISEKSEKALIVKGRAKMYQKWS
jgi:hypothetical protein